MKTNFGQQSLITAFLLTFSCMVYLSLLVSNAKSQTTGLLSQNEYPQDFAEGYQASCQVNAVTEGLSTQQAKTLCNCTLSQFRSKYSLEKFQQLLKKAAKEKAPEELTEVGEFCAQKLIE